MSMFGGTGGYFRLDSWILANIVQLGTQRFCRRFLNRTNDPCGRQYDQMTQAARSGCANIAEGSARRATSKETEMRLTDVARASLAELAGDYLNWLMQQEKTPWGKETPGARAVYAVRLDAPAYGEDVVHDACAHILAQKKKFAEWLDADSDETMANALLILIAALLAGSALFFITHRPPVSPEHTAQFPLAAISADISAARIEDLIKDINRARSQQEEVVLSAKKKAVKAISDLDNDAVAAAWNARIGEYRESRQNQNGSAGNDSN